MNTRFFLVKAAAKYRVPWAVLSCVISCHINHKMKISNTGHGFLKNTSFLVFIPRFFRKQISEKHLIQKFITVLQFYTAQVLSIKNKWLMIEGSQGFLALLDTMYCPTIASENQNTFWSAHCCLLYTHVYGMYAFTASYLWHMGCTHLLLLHSYCFILT